MSDGSAPPAQVKTAMQSVVSAAMERARSAVNLATANFFFVSCFFSSSVACDCYKFFSPVKKSTFKQNEVLRKFCVQHNVPDATFLLHYHTGSPDRSEPAPRIAVSRFK